MATRHLSRSPYQLNAATWIYEEAGGLTIIHKPDGASAGQIGVIPWSKVRNALRRHDRRASKEGKR